MTYTITAKAANQSGQSTAKFTCVETHKKDAGDNHHDHDHDSKKH